MPVLYDQYGQEMKVEKRPDTRAVAVAAVRDRWSSYPAQGLTPLRLGRIFKEADGGDIYRQAELFEEMEEKDTHLFSQLQTRKNAVLGLEYEILPHSDSAEDKKIRDFVAEAIESLSDFDETLLDLLDAVGKGYSLAEIIWDVQGGQATIKDISWISPKRASFFEYDKGPWDRTLQIPRIITEAEQIKGEVMPPFKLVYHRYKARSGHDTRSGILRVCAWMYLFKNYAIKDWVAFAEVFGMPLRLGKYDSGASKDDKAALAAAIQSLGSDAAGIISKTTEIEFIETMKNMGRGSNIYEGLAGFANREISKAILGQTLTTQEGSSGSYSLGQVHDLVRHDLIRSDCKALQKTIGFQVIRPLVGYNFGWDKPLPQFRLQFEEAEDLMNLSEVYKNLVEMGQPISSEHVSQRFKIPLPAKGETVLSKPAASPFAFKNIRRVVAKAQFGDDQAKVEGLVAETQKRAQNALRGVLEPVKQMVANARSLEDLRDNIVAAYADMRPAELQDLLAQALYAAELYGRATVGKD